MIFIPEFDDKLQLTLEQVRAKGHEFEVYRSRVSAEDQAYLWTRSRSEREITSVAKVMRSQGAPEVADLIERCIGSPGRRETDLLPGQSWHQYGEAADLRLIGPEGRVIWVPGHFGYEVLARTAAVNGLVSGYNWRKTNVNHLQLRECSVRSTRPWEDIDQDLRKGTFS